MLRVFILFLIAAATLLTSSPMGWGAEGEPMGMGCQRGEPPMGEFGKPPIKPVRPPVTSQESSENASIREERNAILGRRAATTAEARQLRTEYNNQLQTEYDSLLNKLPPDERRVVNDKIEQAYEFVNPEEQTRYLEKRVVILEKYIAWREENYGPLIRRWGSKQAHSILHLVLDKFLEKIQDKAWDKPCLSG